MDYKKLIDDIKAVVLGKEEELAVQKEVIEEEAPAVEAAPSYVTVSEFQAFKDDNEKFKSELMETFERMIEMVGQNEKNNVPEELEEVKEEVVEEVKEDAVELSAEQSVVVHSPESVEKEVANVRYGSKRETIQSRIFEIISQN